MRHPRMGRIVCVAVDGLASSNGARVDLQECDRRLDKLQELLLPCRRDGMHGRRRHHDVPCRNARRLLQARDFEADVFRRFVECLRHRDTSQGRRRLLQSLGQPLQEILLVMQDGRCCRLPTPFHRPFTCMHLSRGDSLTLEAECYVETPGTEELPPTSPPPLHEQWLAALVFGSHLSPSGVLPCSHLAEVEGGLGGSSRGLK
jgi:hypothetical protein